jgi:hypothetical protein
MVKPDEPTFGFYRYNDFIALPHKPLNWLIHPLIPAGGWINLYGKPKMARKSYWALGASWAISTGQDSWLGFDVRSSGPVFFFQADTPHGFWRQRTMDMASGGYDLSNVWFASMDTMPSPFNILESEAILKEMIDRATEEADEEPAMVVLDTAREIHTGNENDSQEMTEVRHALDRSIGRGPAKCLISHDKKQGAPPKQWGKRDKDEPPEDMEMSTNIMEGSRGSTALSGKMDTVIRLSSKGCMDFQGRASAYERKMLNFIHVHNEQHPCPHKNEKDCMGWVWEESISPEGLHVRQMVQQHPTWSERALGRNLAKQFPEVFPNLDSEAARSVVRRERKKVSG